MLRLSRPKVNMKAGAVFLNGLNGHALILTMVQIRESFIWGRLFFLFYFLGTAYKNQQPKILESVVDGYETSLQMAVSIQPKHASWDIMQRNLRSVRNCPGCSKYA